MDYEKKYKEALERAKQFSEKPYLEDSKGIVEYIFPELKESEDDKELSEILGRVIRRYINDPNIPYTEREKVSMEIIPYVERLEKQGEHAKFCDSIQVGDKVTRNQDGVLVNLSQLNRVAKKQGEQKPADNAEPKFHKGDWVVYCNDDVDLITDIEENGYCINNGGYIPFVCESDIRLWTIEDAKDGDVLVASDGSIFIFKGTIDCACKHYVALTTDDVVKFNEGLEHYWETSTAVHPATKKQRDLLFQKMHDAGYEWDAEHKQLNKIEQKSIKTCAEYYNKDRELKMPVLSEFQDKLADILMHREYDGPDETEDDIAKGRLEYELAAIRLSEELLPLAQKEQKPAAWSEEDKARFESCIEVLQTSDGYNTINAKWLKSLKDRVQLQNTWRPSNEQIHYLSWVANIKLGDSVVEQEVSKRLNELLEDLKKLREE